MNVNGIWQALKNRALRTMNKGVGLQDLDEKIHNIHWHKAGMPIVHNKHAILSVNIPSQFKDQRSLTCSIAKECVSELQDISLDQISDRNLNRTNRSLM